MRPIDANRLKALLMVDFMQLELFGQKYKVSDALRTVDNTPTEDAEPVRHGKWKVTPVYIKCSECGESFMLIPQNYCPNCGARMDKYD